MALSGSTNYTESYSAANLIERSLKRLGVMDASASVSATEQADALVVLNLILKEWAALGVDIFSRYTGHLFLFEPGITTSYTFGTSGTAKFTDQYYTTTLASAASSSDSTITVTDDTNISDTDVVLVELDDGSLHDTVVNGAPSSNVVTLTATMPSAAASGNIVYTWPTANNLSGRVEDLIHISRRLTNTDNVATDAGYMEGIDTPIEIIGEEEYRRLSQKFQTGVPVSVHFRKSPINPELFVWPTGGSGDYHSLVIEHTQYLQDLDATTDTFELPPEGFNALSWQLSGELASEYGLSVQERRELRSVAFQKVEDFLDKQVESAPVMFARDGTRA